MFLALWVGCAPDDGGERKQKDPVVTEDTTTEREPEQTWACPVLESDRMVLTVDGTERSFELLLPDNPAGAPVLFSWHWLNGNAYQALYRVGWHELADQGVVVVSPQGDRDNPFTWSFLEDPEGNADLALFDHILGCLWQELDVDINRIYATGMSAGGLMVSYLLLHRSEWLAAVVPMSGGMTDSVYVTPEYQTPAMITWGGPDDTYTGVSFQSMSLDYSEFLRDDGHFVVECAHDQGHTIHPDSVDPAWAFMSAHSWPPKASPFASGLDAQFPDWCTIP